MNRLSKQFVLGISLSAPMLVYADVEYFGEIDPLAYIVNGYSFHSGFQYQHYRAQAGIFSAEIPRAVSDNKNFSVQQYGYGFKVDYLLAPNGGWFAGIEYSSTTISYRLRSNGVEERKPAKLIGMRTGYQFIFTNGVYLTPWVGLMRNVSDTSTVVISGEKYNVNNVVLFPTVHIGFQF